MQNIADILVDPEGMRERRDHWDKTATSCSTGAILDVLDAEEEQTLARAASFLADPSRSILRTLRIMLTTNRRRRRRRLVVSMILQACARSSATDRPGSVRHARQRLLALGVEHVQDGAGQQRVGGLVPVIAPLARPFRIDQDVGDVLDIAHLVRALAHLQQRIEARRARGWSGLRGAWEKS